VTGAGATIVLTFAAMALFFSNTQVVPRRAGPRISESNSERGWRSDEL